MAFKHSVTIVTSITRIIGISSASTGLFFCQKYKVNTINVNAASIWLLAPNMGQSTHATCLASVELGRDTFRKTSNIAGKIAAMVATYLLVNNLNRRTIPSSVIINLCILVAVSSVVAAKAITSTAISVLASSGEIPYGFEQCTSTKYEGSSFICASMRPRIIINRPG